jgi:rubrerythrin
MNEPAGQNELNRRIDDLIQRLIEADQRGSEIEPMKLAHELGEIKQLLARRKTIRPRPGGEGHWRCETCGTITHASAKPDHCPECGATQLWPADLEQSNVESGAG